MNLREAIRKGSRRVKRRTTGRMVRMLGAPKPGGGYEYAACALGAAYLGCHPDIDPIEVNENVVADWLREFNKRVSQQHGGMPSEAFPELTVLAETIVIDTNDHRVPHTADWDELLDALHKHKARDGTPLDKVEACDLDV